MSDIVERLRVQARSLRIQPEHSIMREAAEMIEMLEKAHVQMQRELDRLYAAHGGKSVENEKKAE